jgi:hypothetical protein
MLEYLTPYIPVLVDAVVYGIVAYVALLVRRWTGVQIEAKHREALHSAIRNGVLVAASRGMTGTDAARLVEGYVTESVPDALKRLAPEPNVVAGLIRAKMAEVLGDAR